MDWKFNGKKENREVSLHVTGNLVHLKVKDIKTIKELPKLTEKTLGKRKKWDGEEQEGMWNKKSILWELEYWPMLDVHHSIDNMHVKKNVCEATYGPLLQQKSRGKIIKMQGRILNSWALGRSSMQRKQRRGRTTHCCNHLVKAREKRILSVFAWFESTLRLLIKLQEASVSEGHENEFQLDEISWLPCVDDDSSFCGT
jgi:hypothetical protein